MKTCYHLIIKVGSEIGILSDWQTTVGIVGLDCISNGQLLGVANITICIVLPIILVCTNSPVEAWVKLASLCLLLLEELIEPWRS